MKPPFFALLMLQLALPKAEAEWIAGDLDEEFLIRLAVEGWTRSSRWYVRQIVRSLFPLFLMRVRSGAPVIALARGLVTIAAPALLLDRLVTFIYSQVPLKDGLGRAPEFLAISLFLICIAAGWSGWRSRGSQSPLMTLAAAMAAAILALWAETGMTPVVYLGATLLLAPASAIAAYYGGDRQ